MFYINNFVRCTSFFVLFAMAIFLAKSDYVEGITGNSQIDTQHDNVGLVVQYTDAIGSDNGFVGRCTGTRISKNVFLTAGHCVTTDPTASPPVLAVSARVWLLEKVWPNQLNLPNDTDPDTGYSSACVDPTKCLLTTQVFNYGFDQFRSYPDTHDVGLVVFDKDNNTLSEPTAGYGKLPTAGALNKYLNKKGQQDRRFTASGYGDVGQRTDSPSSLERTRFEAVLQLVNVNGYDTDEFNTRFSSNPGDDKGGNCSGDSGAANFVGDYTVVPNPNIIVAVHSFSRSGTHRTGIHEKCIKSFDYRMDQEAVFNWIIDTLNSIGYTDDAQFIINNRTSF